MSDRVCLMAQTMASGWDGARRFKQEYCRTCDCRFKAQPPLTTSVANNWKVTNNMEAGKGPSPTLTRTRSRKMHAVAVDPATGDQRCLAVVQRDGVVAGVVPPQERHHHEQVQHAEIEQKPRPSDSI